MPERKAAIPRVLLVEDNPADARLVEEALAERFPQAVLELETSGDAALERLAGIHGGGLPPDLILLDLNLPGRHGREVLQAVKQHPLTRAIPVVILSSTASAKETAELYDLHANLVATKPLDIEPFYDLVERICLNWIPLQPKAAL